MVKYIILAYSNDKTFDIPRQLVEVNGEKLVQRTIRLLKENGVKDILITAKDKRFEGLGAEVYTPKKNTYDYITHTGYWLDAFPFELMNEPVCFIWGDVYFSENAIKTIVETETDSTLFFCTYKNNSPLYIKHHDEPLAYKVVNTDLFKKHINKVKKLFDEGKTVRHPIVWEVYRSINNQDVNEHIMTKNYIAINDESCDIDGSRDIIKLRIKLGGIEMIKVEVLEDFNLKAFDELKNIKRRNKSEKGKLFFGDTFECTKEMAEYLTGKNALNKAVVKIIEVIPEEKETKVEKPVEKKPMPKKTTKPKKKKK